MKNCKDRDEKQRKGLIHEIKLKILNGKTCLRLEGFSGKRTEYRRNQASGVTRSLAALSGVGVWLDEHEVTFRKQGPHCGVSSTVIVP